MNTAGRPNPQFRGSQFRLYRRFGNNLINLLFV
jgi:hypothetical protein